MYLNVNDVDTLSNFEEPIKNVKSPNVLEIQVDDIDDSMDDSHPFA